MTRFPPSIVLLAGSAAFLLASTAAMAIDPCLGDAKDTFVECKGGCKEDLQLAKDNCLNRDHACVEICRATREECELATGLDDALTVCRDALRLAKDGCRSAYAEGSTELDACIDGAQLVAFQCRRAARVAARPALLVCRDDFRTCAKACPPPADQSEVIDPTQCKLDAKVVATECKLDCREQRQVQKDLCLDRDHVCVEACRGQRDDCREPIEDQLDLAITACNATRDTSLDACAPDDADCIATAYVAAFQCRDGSREVARPQLEACGGAFQTCAEACPPAL